VADFVDVSGGYYLPFLLAVGIVLTLYLAPPILYGSLIQLLVYCYVKINRMLESALFDVTRHYVLFKPALVRYCRYCQTYPGEEEKRMNPPAPPRLLFGLLSLHDRFADDQWHGVDRLCSGGFVLLSSSVSSPATTIVEDSVISNVIIKTRKVTRLNNVLVLLKL
jgi:hypothetical protein